MIERRIAKPIVGQILFSLNTSNAARFRPQTLTPVKVTSVGRKYFKVAPVDCPHHQVEYHLASWREKTEYCPESQLYTSAQEWEDEKESVRLCHDIHEAFQWGKNPKGIDLATLRQIHELLVTELAKLTKKESKV